MPTFPSIPFNNVNLRSVNPTRISQVINGVEQRNAVGSQYYAVSASFRNLTKSQQRQLMAFIDEVRGPLTAFDLVLPDYLGDSTAGFTGTLTIDQNYAAGVTAVGVTSTATTGQTVLKAGDLIRFASHSKIYSVTEDAYEASNGVTTINLSQPLRLGVSAASTVTHQDLPISVRFTSDTNEFFVDAAEYATFSLEFREVLT